MMPPTKTRWVIILSLCAVSAAAEQPGAEALYRHGVELFAQGALEASAAVLERARHRTREPRLLALIELHLGLNAATTHRRAQAREHFRRAVRHDPALHMDPQQYKPELVRLYEEVRAEEAAIARRVLGRPDRVASRPAPSTRPGPAVVKPQPVEIGQPTAQPRRPRRLWTWVAAGSAVAVAAAGLGLGLSARSDYSSACDLLEGAPECSARRDLKQESDRHRFEILHDQVGQKSLAANVCWGVAGALAVTAVVLYFVEGRVRRGESPGKKVGLRIGAGPSLALEPSGVRAAP
jgi:hypothetical protein